MIARLFNAPLGELEAAIGVGTVGSSEAIMLAGLAFKRRWQNKRKAQGLPYDKPNIVTGANVQVFFINTKYTRQKKISIYIQINLCHVSLDPMFLWLIRFSLTRLIVFIFF